MITVPVRIFALCGAALVAGAVAPATAVAQPAQAWEIGPIIRGKNHSVGMPLSPRPAGRGWSFEFPYPDERAGHVHYVTFDHGSLAGRTSIVLRYRVEAAPGVRFVPRENPSSPATVSLYFQRRGDSWSGRRHEHHRWYAPAQTVRELAPGEHEITVDLGDGGWISVWGKSAAQNPAAFRDAIADAGRVGIVFGSSAARGHGVYATGPARFTLTGFRLR